MPKPRRSAFAAFGAPAQSLLTRKTSRLVAPVSRGSLRVRRAAVFELSASCRANGQAPSVFLGFVLAQVLAFGQVDLDHGPRGVELEQVAVHPVERAGE